MKKIFSVVLALCLLTPPLTACSKEATSAPESAVSVETMSVADYLELGNKYLSEGNYQEAIIAFTAAIDIDPNNTDAYMGRARTYVAEAKASAPEGVEIVDWPEELIALYKQAENDYLKAIGIDQQLVDAYLELADLYIEQGETDKALEILEQGYNLTNMSELSEKLQEMKEKTFNPLGEGLEAASGSGLERWLSGLQGIEEEVWALKSAALYTPDGRWFKTHHYFYDEFGRLYRMVNEDSQKELDKSSDRMVEEFWKVNPETGTWDWKCLWEHGDGRPESEEMLGEDDDVRVAGQGSYKYIGDAAISAWFPDFPKGSSMRFYYNAYPDTTVEQESYPDFPGSKIFYTFDENGNVSQVKLYDENGNLHSYAELTFEKVTVLK